MTEKNKKILIIGVDGIIGSRLLRFFYRMGLPTVGTVKKPMVGFVTYVLGVTPPDDLDLREVNICIICAGITNMARCEAEPKETFLVNVDATFKLIKHLATNGIFSLFLSSNMVFDGLTPDNGENATTSPTNEYGRQKQSCESRITTDPVARKLTAIVRMTKNISAESPIIKRIIDLNAPPVTTYTDVDISPISSLYICQSISRIVLTRSCGIFHLSGERNISYHGLLSIICVTQKYSDCRLIPVQNRSKHNIRYPVYGSLGMDLTIAQVGVKPQPLIEFIEHLDQEIFKIQNPTRF